MADFGTVVNGGFFDERKRWYDDVFNPLGLLVRDLEDLADVPQGDWYTPMGSRDSWLEANLHRFDLEVSSPLYPDGPGWFDTVGANWQAAWEHLNDLYELQDAGRPAQDPTSWSVWDDINSAVNFLAGYQTLANALHVLFTADEEEDDQEEAAGLVPTRLDADDVSYLLENEDCQRYFSTTFNKEVITFVPIIHNFYLTNKYFRNINKAMDNTKDRALDILLSTIRNDDNFDNTPDMTRPAAAAAIANSTGQDQNEAFNSAARDFILKVLIKTPIDILKGVVELVDPHVALTKIIKVGTGKAFNDLAKELDAPARGINEELTGEDLLKLVLCFVDQSLSVADSDSNSQLPQVDGASGDNFFPRISIDGVDFTGTVSGMLMVPPSPLGLIYLLLELLKNEVTDAVENVDQAGTEAANETEC